jgi:hypothetical protein
MQVPRVGLGPFEGCPYVGLRAFQAGDAHLFFGRGQETLDALAALGAQQAVDPGHAWQQSGTTHPRWLQIEGGSGSGKSSLVNAGLLPMVERGALWARTGFDQWQVIGPVLPGGDPLERLAEATERVLVPGEPSRRTLQRLAEMERDERAFSIALRDARRDDSAFLLVVDQFEELFTLADPDRRRLFEAQLAYALGDTMCPLYLVSTVRSDFLDRFELLPRLQPLANRLCKRYLLSQISEEGLREIIERPAQLAGLDVREVVGVILDDARDEPGALPLVENALVALWAEREGERLTASAYRRLNGIAGMLSSQADALLARIQAAVPRGREAALELLLRLTRVGNDGRHTRQRITLREAVATAGDGDNERGGRVVRMLSGESDDAPRGAQRGGALRLITTFGMQRSATSESARDEQYVDLIHETLIRSRTLPGGTRIAFWPTIFDYVEANRDRDVDRQQLRMLAEAWGSRSGLGRWRGLPTWAELRRFRRLRVPAQTQDGEYLKRGQFAARMRAAVGVVAAATALVFAESLVWSRQPLGLSESPEFEDVTRWPPSYALFRPFWLLGILPQPSGVILNGGSFQMGCVRGRDDAREPCAPDDVHPAPSVDVPGPVWMARALVTYREFDAYAMYRLSRGDQGLRFPDDSRRTRGDRPVVNVDWHQASEYARWWGQRDGRQCRLPTEAEWEFAARGAGGALSLPGPVAEWIQDSYEPYSTRPNAAPPADGDAPRVVRGLSAVGGLLGNRIAARAALQPDEIAGAVGFRIVCTESR